MPEPKPLNVSPDVKFIDPVSGLANFDTTVVSNEIPEAQIISKAKEIIESRLNPFAESVEKLMHEIEGLDLEGSIKLGDGSVMSYKDAMSRNSGWKLHLNFDPDNTQVVGNFMQLLNTMETAGAISAYKIGHGGGKKSGQPGKEATVYIGHRDKAQLVANFLADNMSDRGLLPPEGETLEDDLPFNNLVMGRFEIINTHHDLYNQYGFSGLAAPKYIANRWMAEGFRQNMNPKEREQKIKEEHMEAIRFTAELFGDYFTGKEFPTNVFPPPQPVTDQAPPSR